MSDVPELIDVVCRRCARAFQFMGTRQSRLFCDGCLKARNFERGKQRRARICLQPGERAGQCADGMATVAVRTNEEVAKILKVTPQAVQQQVRALVTKLRGSLVLKAVWLEHTGRAEGLQIPAKRGTYQCFERVIAEWENTARRLALSGFEQEAEQVLAEADLFRQVWREELEMATRGEANGQRPIANSQ